MLKHILSIVATLKHLINNEIQEEDGYLEIVDNLEELTQLIQKL